MLEIGRMQKLLVPTGRIGSGAPRQEKIVGEQIKRITRRAYGHNSTFARKLVVMLHGDDTITIKPYLGRDEKMTVSFNVGRVYKTLLAQKLLVEAAEKARQKKAQAAQRREQRNRDARERNFRKRVRRDNERSKL